MYEMTFSEALSYFKKNETAENIVPLVDDEQLRSGVVAWKSVVIKNKESSGSKCSSESELWEWMWTQIDFTSDQMRGFAVVAGCKGQDSASLFQRLKGLRLIYPDGTINAYAARYLQSIILAKLPKAEK